MKPWSLYLVRAAGGVLYTGITTDVRRRFEQHRAGRGAKYLRGRGTLALVYQRRLGERGLALSVERRLKRLTKSEKEELVRRAPSRKRLLALLACLLVLLPLVRAQDAAARARELQAARSQRAAVSLAAARKSLAAGKREDALAALHVALELDPASIETQGLFVEACAGDEDARRFWLHSLARTALAGTRTNTLDAAARRHFAGPAAAVLQLEQSFASAAEELARFAREREKDGASRPDSLLVAQWARRAASDLAQRSPALAAALEDELSPRLTLSESLPGKTVRALELLAEHALANSRPAVAIDAARILAGLRAQLAMKDLEGPRPSAGVGALEKSAPELLGRARTLLSGRLERPWTVEELERLDAEQVESFTRLHDSFANPGVATSPRGWYRIETDCGHGTLLGAARTVELHHQRLAGWYGKDPFEGQPGLLRIVPEATGLEAEGAPFWWAGGFQAGDTTVVRLSCAGGQPTIEGLGHLLTHELTHRFDGRLFPGIPAWLAEGKAVWTGGAYGASSATGFVENHASFGAMIDALNKGYGAKEKLEKLLEGAPPDYRDNYSAGHALYVYLRSRKAGGDEPLFARALLDYQRRMRQAKSALGAFLECFCDGEQGRPATLEAFCADWGPWLAGFLWTDPKPWVKEYTGSVPGEGSPALLEDPLWGWSRNRAEPRFGQGQALLAGRLFAEAGKRDEAILAWIWALAVDGRVPDTERALAALLETSARADAAWCLRQGLEFPYGSRVGPPPFQGLLPRTTGLLAALAAAENAAHERGLALTGARLKADRVRLASWLGVHEPAPAGEALDTSSKAIAFDGPALALARAGWGEAGLTGYEERRAKGRWCTDDEGNLVVGSDRPPLSKLSTGTGVESVERGAAWVECFALAPDWVLAGSWRLDCRIRFLTSYVGGAIVFGYREREENLRYSFNAGDYQYAIGFKDKREYDFDAFRGWLGGLRDRDAGLGSGSSGGEVRFEAPRSSVWISLVVDGAEVEVLVDGKPAGRYATVDGAPVEGRIGFATSMGVIGVEGARVTRLDRARLANARNSPAREFDLASARSQRPWEALPCAARGLAPPVQGRLVLWVPAAERPFDDASVQQAFLRRVQRQLRDAGKFLVRELPTQPLLVALPPGLDDEGRAWIEAEAKQLFAEGAELRVHAQAYVAPPPESGAGKTFLASSAWLIFVDHTGCVRASTPLHGGKLRDEEGFTRWLRVFRDHGRPARELGLPVREEPTRTEER